jgi:hypothetical protein
MLAKAATFVFTRKCGADKVQNISYPTHSPGAIGMLLQLTFVATK